MPSKQHIIQETVCRENVHILGHVVWFKMAIEELNNRIQELATEIRSSEDLDTVKESADLMIKYSQLQASVTSSLEIALDTVLKQNMTLACNMLLPRRDSLLKDCSSKLGPKDLASLRTDHFAQQEVFNSDILSQVEDNMIKRLSIMKETDTKSYRDSVKNFDFGRSSHPKSSQESSRSFRDKRTQPKTSYNHFSTRASRGGRGGKRSDFPGTRLQDFWQVWAKNHAHPRVVSLLQHGYRLDFKILPKLSKIPHILSKYHNKNKYGALHEAVQAMLAKKAITHVRNPTTLGYYSRLFLVPKPMKRWRPVIDLSMLNNHLHVLTFKMETAESIRKSIRKGEWVTSIDLTDAYFHVPIHPQSQKYLRFQTKKGIFQFRALPFGVATAPLEFTHIVKEVKLIAQARNLRIHQYLDDWLLRSPTKEQCLKDSENLVKLVQELGWLINFQKSELVPTQKLDFLGYHFDLQRVWSFQPKRNLIG